MDWMDLLVLGVSGVAILMAGASLVASSVAIKDASQAQAAVIDGDHALRTEFADAMALAMTTSMVADISRPTLRDSE